MTIKSILNRFAVCAVAAAVMTSGCFVTFAESNEGNVPDFDKENSVSVTLKSKENDKLVSGAEFKLYKVADVTLDDGDLVYSTVGDFAADEVDVSKLSDADYAASLEKKASNETASGTTDDNGTLKFSSLKAGLYLVVNTKAASGYLKVNSFLVTAPSLTDGTWVYDVDASPKMETAAAGSPTPSPTPTATPPAKIPQTGQVNWPIPVLAISGLILFSVGWLLRKSKKNDEA